MAEDSRIEILRTAYRAPTMHAICARFLGSVHRECLDPLLILCEAHLRRALRASVPSFNEQRPHQGIAQRIPVPGQRSPTELTRMERVEAVPVLGGLHHVYQRVT